MNREDKQDFVRRYVEQQRAYLSAYGRDGPVEFGDHCTSLQGTPRTDPVSGFGFDTPILRPRKACLRQGDQAHPGGEVGRPPSKGHDKQLPPFSQYLRTSQRETEKENASLPPTRKKAPARHKRKKVSSNDDEYEARLAERYERKKRKREVVKCPVDDDDVDDRSSGRSCRASKCKTTKARKKAHVPIPAAFALLHGFSATNVKRDRLTLKSDLRLGVFGKGKASVKAKVWSKKPVPAFSELAFLNRKDQKARGYEKAGASELSTASPSSQSVESSHLTPTKRATATSNSPSKKSTDRKIAKCIEETRDPLKGPKSIVWDIESKNECPLSVHSSPVRLGGSASASVVLNLRDSCWFVQGDKRKIGHESLPRPAPSDPIQRTKVSPETQTHPDTLETNDVVVLPHGGESSSLHPSHSASQVVYCDLRHQPNHVVSHPQPTVSQYFSQPCRAVSPITIPDARPASASGDHRQTSGGPEWRLGFRPADSSFFSLMEVPLTAPQRASFCASHQLLPKESLGELSNEPLHQSPVGLPVDAMSFWDDFPEDQSVESRSYVEEHVQGYYWAADEGHQQDLQFYEHVGSDASNCYDFQCGHGDVEFRTVYGPSAGHNADFMQDPAIPQHVGGKSSLMTVEQDIALTAETTLDCAENSFPSEYDPLSPEKVDFLPNFDPSVDEGDFHSEYGLLARGDECNHPSECAILASKYEDNGDDCEERCDACLFANEDTRRQNCEDCASSPCGIAASGSPSDVQNMTTAFLEGRALLLGFSDPIRTGLHIRPGGRLDAEMDVATRLRAHWRPQKLG